MQVNDVYGFPHVVHFRTKQATVLRSHLILHIAEFMVMTSYVGREGDIERLAISRDQWADMKVKPTYQGKIPHGILETESSRLGLLRCESFEADGATKVYPRCFSCGKWVDDRFSVVGDYVQCHSCNRGK